MRPRCAIYARYSSDRQTHPTSIDDQIRKCREFADRAGYDIVERHIYADEAVSGAGADRPSLQRLIHSTKRVPREFDVVLVDDTSRLARDLVQMKSLSRDLQFLGIRMVSVSQGIDTRQEQSEVLITVHGLVDELYTRELAKKTHRGMEGAVLRGHHPGGRCFGYVSEHTPDGAMLRINEQEAAIVRRIFELSAGGASLKAITKKLNEEQAPPPRPRAGRVASWCPTAIREMLYNERYRGRIVWNRSKFVKRPGTNKRVARPRPEQEWTFAEHPELRIVSDELWAAVRARFERMRKQFGGFHPGLLNASACSRYLLSGFLVCDVCGGKVVIVTGRGKREPRYGCSNNFNRGTCPNNLKERQNHLEQQLFSELQSSVLTPEIVDYAVQRFCQQLTRHVEEALANREPIRRRRDEVQAEVARLASAIAHVGHSQALLSALQDRERELGRLNEQLSSEVVPPSDLPTLRRFVLERLFDVRRLLAADVEGARAELARHVREIRLVPKVEQGKAYYVATGEWSLLSPGVGERFGWLRGTATYRTRSVFRSRSNYELSGKQT